MDIEFERIIISPMDYEIDVRKKLWHFLRDMHIHYEYEYY
jgi:hypothetical protein